MHSYGEVQLIITSQLATIYRLHKLLEKNTIILFIIYNKVFFFVSSIIIICTFIASQQTAIKTVAFFSRQVYHPWKLSITMRVREEIAKLCFINVESRSCIYSHHVLRISLACLLCHLPVIINKLDVAETVSGYFALVRLKSCTQSYCNSNGLVCIMTWAMPICHVSGCRWSTLLSFNCIKSMLWKEMLLQCIEAVMQ